MKNTIIAVLLSFAIAGCNNAAIKEQPLLPGSEPRLKTLSFDEFMNNSLSVSINLDFLVPDDYFLAALNAPATYSYWMPRSVVTEVNNTKDMPVDTGWMYGKVTMSVGYDKDSDTFIGAEDIVNQSKRAGYINVKHKRYNINGYPVLFLEMEQKSKGVQIYSAYIAMNVATNVVYISYRPPLGKKALGEYVWENFKSSLVKI